MTVEYSSLEWSNLLKSVEPKMWYAIANGSSNLSFYMQGNQLAHYSTINYAKIST
jgi:hypothetical protein